VRNRKRSARFRWSGKRTNHEWKLCQLWYRSFENLERYSKIELLVLEDQVGEEKLTDREVLWKRDETETDQRRARLTTTKSRTDLLVLLENQISLMSRLVIVVALNFEHSLQKAREPKRRVEGRDGSLLFVSQPPRRRESINSLGKNLVQPRSNID